MAPLSWVLFVIASLVFLVFPTNGQGVYDVCVLGGGSSGMNMAVQLKDRGYNVHVIEVQDYIGGHCNTVRFPGGWVDAGVAVFPNTTLANELGFGPWLVNSVEYIQRFAGADAIVPSQYNNEIPYQANFATGANLGPYEPQVYSEEFGLALETALNFAKNLYPWADTMIDVPNPIPAELLVPLTEWIETNNLEYIYIILNGTLWIGGYGSFTEMRALDGIAQALGGTSLLYDTHPGSWFSVNNGCQSIYDGITAYLGAEAISLSTTIDLALRPPAEGFGSEQPTVLLGTKNGFPFEATCGKVVVAFQQTPQKIAFLLPDATESSVFQGVTVVDTTVASLTMEGPLVEAASPFILTNAKPDPPLNQPNIPALLDVERPLYGGTTGHGCAVGFSQTLIPPPELEFIMEEGATGIPKAYLTGVQFDEFWQHIYSPRFPTAALEAEVPAYLQLDALQGHRNTYWVGSIRTTENSVSVWNYNTFLVNNLFPPK